MNDSVVSYLPNMQGDEPKGFVYQRLWDVVRSHGVLTATYWYSRLSPWQKRGVFYLLQRQKALHDELYTAIEEQYNKEGFIDADK